MIRLEDSLCCEPALAEPAVPVQRRCLSGAECKWPDAKHISKACAKVGNQGVAFAVLNSEEPTEMAEFCLGGAMVPYLSFSLPSGRLSRDCRVIHENALFLQRELTTRRRSCTDKRNTRL